MQQSHKHSHTQKPKRNSSTRSHAGHRCRREGKNGAMPKNGAHPDVHIHDNFKSDKTITGSEIRQRAKSCWKIMVNKAHLAKYSNRENTQRDVSRISGRWEPRTRSTGSGGGGEGGIGSLIGPCCAPTDSFMKLCDEEMAGCGDHCAPMDKRAKRRPWKRVRDNATTVNSPQN
jgi:hypothetical protein